MALAAPVRSAGKSSSKSSTRRGSKLTHCIAVDLGVATVRVVEVQWTGASGTAGASARILHRGTAPLPRDTWNDLPANRDNVANAIRTALVAAGITAKSVIVCIPRHLVTLKVAQLPASSPEQMRGMVAFEAQQYIPFALDDVILDYHVLADTTLGLAAGADGMENVLIAAARRTLITEVLDIFSRAKLEVDRLSVSALALAENIQDAVEPTALIDLEPNEMDMAVVTNGNLLFTRAAMLKGSNSRNDEAWVRVPEAEWVRLAEEVVRSFTAYQNEYRQQPLTRVYLSGAGATGSEAVLLERMLGDLLEMPVERMQSSLLPLHDEDAHIYATAIGLALQATGRGLAPINLVPTALSEQKVAETQKRRQMIMVLAAVAFIAIIYFPLSNGLKTRAKNNAEMLRANKSLQDITDNLQARQKVYDRFQSLDSALATGLDRNHPAVDVLAAVNLALPKTANVWLTQFDFIRGGVLTLHGNAKDEAAATDLVIRLQDSGAFSEVKIGYLGDAQDEQLTRAANSAPPKASVSAPSQAAPLLSPLPAMPAAPPANGAVGTTPGGAAVPGAAPGAPSPGAMPSAGGAPNAMPPGFTPGAGGRGFGRRMQQGGFPGMPGAGGPGVGMPGRVPTGGAPVGAPGATVPTGAPTQVRPVPPPTLPDVRTVVKQHLASTPKAATVTNFVITATINEKSKNLLPASLPTPKLKVSQVGETQVVEVTSIPAKDKSGKEKR